MQHFIRNEILVLVLAASVHRRSKLTVFMYLDDMLFVLKLIEADLWLDQISQAKSRNWDRENVTYYLGINVELK